MADPIAYLCEIIAEKLRDEPEVSLTALVAYVKTEIAENPELVVKLKTDQRMRQINRDEVSAHQTLVENGIANIGIHYHLSETEKFETALETVIKQIQTFETQAVDCQPYLRDRENTRRQFREKIMELENRKKNLPSKSYYYFYVSLDKIEKLAAREVATENQLDSTVQRTVLNTSTSQGKTEEYRSRCNRLEDLISRFTDDDQIQNLTDKQLIRDRDLRKGTIYRLKKQLCNSFKRYIYGISVSHVDIKPGWGYAEIHLKRKKETSSILNLQGHLGDIEFLFSCSEKFFFDYDPNLEKLNTTSTNHLFLKGLTSYQFRTHFFILSVDRKRKVVFCSPIYLALPKGILN
ncbi:MAG: hypothetical protein F6K54_14745 [Okeania sp. SIO3B5]|uniref:hypothetical protein n=1 Tax=Okeania sp. SIO3B5 TaxID=2607811 RepID=UPI0014000CD0|nr:hypothetical protein [Okeania sp. SIO3B5]NEO54228.1 hypothetical protein [Okeania sp. SIO3B5]